jgi:hypothetical protein
MVVSFTPCEITRYPLVGLESHRAGLYTVELRIFVKLCNKVPLVCTPRPPDSMRPGSWVENRIFGAKRNYEEELHSLNTSPCVRGVIRPTAWRCTVTELMREQACLRNMQKEDIDWQLALQNFTEKNLQLRRKMNGVIFERYVICVHNIINADRIFVLCTSREKMTYKS